MSHCRSSCQRACQCAPLLLVSSFGSVNGRRRQSFSSWKTKPNSVLVRRTTSPLTSPKCSYATAIPAQVQEELDLTLRANERSSIIHQGAIYSCDSNQLAANTPCEDHYSQAKCVGSNAWLFGVFDGHGGVACAARVASLLFDYICAAILRKHHSKSMPSGCKVQWLHSTAPATSNQMYVQSHMNSVKRFMEDFRSSDNYLHGTVRQALQTAFVTLDENLANEALPDVNGRVSRYHAASVYSGSCSTVAHVRGPHLHVANCGDSIAVLGVRSDQGGWMARQLTKEHCFDNQSEVDRIRNNHPINEADTVLKGGRLLGQLFPLRSFGDVRYKWTEDLQQVVLEPLFPDGMGVPPNLHTPPYLTALPDVFYHRLTPNDKFLILATDGLWDMLSPERVVRLLADHTVGVETLGNFVPSSEESLKQIMSSLRRRKEGESKRPKDENSASHLIRYALGGMSEATQYHNLREMLKLSPRVARNFRDDITVTVIHFDTEYLKTANVPR